MEEGVDVVRKLWRGEPVTHEGRFFSFPETHMQPGTLTSKGPPIWFGGRSDRALDRIGRIGDGWISYVVTPDMYKAGLEKIARAFGAKKCCIIVDQSNDKHGVRIQMAREIN